MEEREFLTEQFEEHRPHLRAVAYRMLGSTAEADDAVQEAWLRLSRSDAGEIDNLGGWLTNVAPRVGLNAARGRRSRARARRRAEGGGGGGAAAPPPPSGPAGAPDGSSPEHEALLADSV